MLDDGIFINDELTPSKIDYCFPCDILERASTLATDLKRWIYCFLMKMFLVGMLLMQRPCVT